MAIYDFAPDFSEDMKMLDAETQDNQKQYDLRANSLGMAYSPYQDFDDYFTDYGDALDNASLFRNLIKTFNGNNRMKR